MNENNDRALGSEMHVYCISQVREKRLDERESQNLSHT